MHHKQRIILLSATCLSRQSSPEFIWESCFRDANVVCWPLTIFWCLVDFPWFKEVEQHLKDPFHLSTFRSLQLKAINLTLSGRDLFLVMPTGRGKSLCYQLPALCSKGTPTNICSVGSESLSSHWSCWYTTCKVIRLDARVITSHALVRFYIGCQSLGVPDGGSDNVPEIHQCASSHAQCVQYQGNLILCLFIPLCCDHTKSEANFLRE